MVLNANTSRNNAVINGTDSVTFGIDNPVEQKFFVYGRPVSRSDDKKETVVNANAVKRRGEISVDFQSNWIQSQAAAKSLGDWINKHWSDGMDEYRIESFMNPLISIGDLVTLNHPKGGVTPATHKFYVVEVSHSYSEGMETSVVLRRVKLDA